MIVQLLEQLVFRDDLVGAAVDHAKHHRQQSARGLPPALQNLSRVPVMVLPYAPSRKKTKTRWYWASQAIVTCGECRIH